MSQMSQVSVVILNWNGKKFLKDCLDSVLTQSYPNLEIIVVDNGSTDSSPKIIKRGYPSIKLIENQENQGFSKAANQGITEASGSHILSLNNDVVLSPSFVEEAVNAISKDERIGSVSGKLLKSPPQNGTIDSAGHIIFKNRLAFDRGDGETDAGQYDSFEYVFGACAAAALYRREMLEDVKVKGEYFDEAFFAFLEDVDLSWRAQLRGWKSVYVPNAVAYHYRGGTAVRRSKLVEIHNYKNRYLMILKNDSFWGVLMNMHHFVATDTLKTGALLFRCPAALLGWGEILKEVPNTLSKRREIQKRRKVSQKEIENLFQKFDYNKWIKRHFLDPEW
jgi:GT2 family glycosyltransferase